MKYLDELSFKRSLSRRITWVLHKPTEKRLTEIPSKILHELIENIDQKVDKRELIYKVWGDHDYFIGRSFDVHLRKIRQFLKDTGSGLEIPRSVQGKIILEQKR